MANPEHVEIVKQGAEAIRAWREENPGARLDLKRANLSGADLSRADLTGAELEMANLSEADLRATHLVEAHLSAADLSAADLGATDLTGADLREALVGGACFLLAWGMKHAHNIETVKIIPRDKGDVLYFETCTREWPERWLDWERLRTVGRLPLFGASYAVLILIPLVFYGLALYNSKVELVRAWAEQVAITPDNIMHRVAMLIKDRLNSQPIPSLSFLLLISTVLLAIGSTLYTFLCPSRIKEFSRDQWCDQLGRSLIHYWPLAWKHRWARLTCAICYALGGAGALIVIIVKVAHAGWFIVQHSALPWPFK